MPTTWIHPGDVFEVSNEGALKEQVLRMAFGPFVLWGMVHEPGADTPVDEVDSTETIDSTFVVPGADNGTVSLESECRPQSGHKGESCLVLTEKNYLARRCSFFNSSISRCATACFSGFARRNR